MLPAAGGEGLEVGVPGRVGRGGAGAGPQRPLPAGSRGRCLETPGLQEGWEGVLGPDAGTQAAAGLTHSGGNGD